MATRLDVAILRVAPEPGDGIADVAPPPVVFVKAPEIADALPAQLAIDDPSGADTIVPRTPPTTIAPDTIAIALDRRDAPADTILRARCDDLARRIIREGGHVSRAALAREIGCAPATLARLMATDIYRDTYNRVSDELLGTIDDRIADERLDTLVRSDSLQRRALTVLSEAMMIARHHMADVGAGKVVARPQLLKVAVDAAAEVRQVVTARSGVAGNGTTVNINVTRNQATIIQGAIRESGIDLSDVLDGVIIPAVVNGG